MKNIFLLVFVSLFSFGFSQIITEDTLCLGASLSLPSGGFLTPTNSGTYSDTLLATNGNDSIISNVFIPSADSIFIDSYTDPTCSPGNDGTITIGGLTPSTYVLDVNASSSIFSPTGTTFTLTGLTDGNYVMGITNSYGCNSNTITQILTNATDFIFITSVTNPTGCGIADGTVTIEGLTPGTTYDAPIGTVAGTTYTFTGMLSGQHSFVAIKTSSGCVSNSVDISFIDPSAPQAPNIITNNQIACPMSDLTLSTDSLNAAYTYNWTGPSITAANQNLSSLTIPNVTLSDTGNYCLTLEQNGCVSATTCQYIPEITYPAYILIDTTITSNQFYYSNGIALNTSGTYIDTLTTIHGCDSTIELHLTVLQANMAPTCLNDTTTTMEDNAVIVNVLLNDTDTTGSIDATSVNIVTAPTNGTAIIDPVTGEIIYTPDPNFNGSDYLTYSVCDDGNPLPVLCDTAWVFINVDPANNPPVALNDTATTLMNTSIDINVAANDSDPNDPLGNIDPATVTQITPAYNGSFSIAPTTGIINYTPDLNYLGKDSFQYVICDDGNPLPVLCDTAWVYINVVDTTLSGTITTSTALPLENSIVYLIKYIASTDSVYTSDSTSTDINGFYEFTSVSQNDYIKAIPDLANYSNEIPTYNVSAATFQNANALNITALNNTANFSTIAGINPGGNGFISGIVGSGAGKNSETGLPINGLSLILINANNEVVEQTTTNIAGEFSFDDLETTTYSLWVDKAGIDNLLAPSISLTEDENQENLNFVLHKTFLEELNNVSIQEIKEGSFKFYPNPTEGLVTIQSEENEILELNIFNLIGEQLVDIDVNNHTYQLDLNSTSIAKGTYIIQLTTKKDTYFTRLVYR